jgi:hypothetical protein
VVALKQGGSFVTSCLVVHTPHLYSFIIACTLDMNLLCRSKGLSELLTLTILPHHMHEIRDIVCQLRANTSTCVIFYLEYQPPLIQGKNLGPKDNTIFFNGILSHKFILSSPNCDRNSVTLEH